MITDGGWVFEDKLITFSCGPGYGYITLTIDLNDSEEIRRVEIELNRDDAEKLRGYLSTVE